MRNRPWAKSSTRRPSLARIAALTGTLVFHIVIVAQLWLHARVVPQQRVRSAITLQLYDAADLPPIAPAAPEPPLPATEATPRPDRAVPVASAPDVDVERDPPALEDVPRPQPEMSIDEQRAAVAAEIARESAPVRRPFRGRSIDAMLPDGDKGTLPGFRPRTVDDPSKLLRKFGQMLSQGVPSAAVDPDAPMDLLTEGWEAKHHGSDLQSCELQYEDLDADLRRQMCGEVGRGQ